MRAGKLLERMYPAGGKLSVSFHGAPSLTELFPGIVLSVFLPFCSVLYRFELPNTLARKVMFELSNTIRQGEFRAVSHPKNYARKVSSVVELP